MVTITIASIIPSASPFLNQDFYVTFGFAGSTFTNAFCTIASVVAPIKSAGASFAAIYPAGTVATGTYTIYAGYYTASGGSFANNKTIQIKNSDIADPAKTLRDLLKSNLGSTYASTLVTTGWYSTRTAYPTITVTRGRKDDRTGNLFDTFRDHTETLFVDTWVTGRDTAGTIFGQSSRKYVLTLLDSEVKRIINAQRKSPSTKLRHMQIFDSQPMDEISDNRKIFRTRHSIRVLWDETIS